MFLYTGCTVLRGKTEGKIYALKHIDVNAWWQLNEIQERDFTYQYWTLFKLDKPLGRMGKGTTATQSHISWLSLQRNGNHALPSPCSVCTLFSFNWYIWCSITRTLKVSLVIQALRWEVSAGKPLWSLVAVQKGGGVYVCCRLCWQNGCCIICPTQACLIGCSSFINCVRKSKNLETC